MLCTIPNEKKSTKVRKNLTALILFFQFDNTCPVSILANRIEGNIRSCNHMFWFRV